MRNEEEEITFTGERRETVIDYVLRGREVWKNMERMEMGNEVKSDDQSMSVWMGKRRERERGKKEKEWRKREDWSEETREEFRIRTEKIKIGKGG